MKQDRRLTRRDLVIVALLLLCAAGIGGYRYWQRSQETPNPFDLLGGMPGVVAFSSTDCGACILQKEILDSLAPRYDGRAKFVRVDVYKHLDLALDLGVRAIPTLFFVDKSGQIVDQRVGLTQAEDIMAQLELMGITR